MKPLLFTSHLVCVAVGLAGGWLLFRGSHAEPASQSVPRAAPPPPVPASQVQSASAPPSKQPPQTSPAPVGDSKGTAPLAGAKERLGALSWFRENGVGVGVPLFSNDGPIDRGFVLAFDLLPAEAERLERALANAKAQMTEQVVAATKVRVDESNTAMVIETPAIAAKGTEVYRDLLGTFQEVLGPERMGYFNRFCGAAFDRSFDDFGANEKKIEVSVEWDGDHFVYNISEHFTRPSGHGTSGSRLRPEDVGRYFPALAKVIPPGFGQPRPKK